MTVWLRYAGDVFCAPAAVAMTTNADAAPTWSLAPGSIAIVGYNVTIRRQKVAIIYLEMDRPERAAALAYLRRKGTEAPASRLLSGLGSTFRKLEETIDGVPEALRTQRPTATSWSVHEIVDHLVESHRPAVTELWALSRGISPSGGPIPARLTSPNALERPWRDLVHELKSLHVNVLDLVTAAGDATPVVATAPFVMLVKIPGAAGYEVLEWVEALDWKAYAQALRIHSHEHCAQVDRTVAALRSDVASDVGTDERNDA